MENEIALWSTVLAHPSGIGLDFAGGLLSAQRKEDGSFEIEWEVDGEMWHKAFVASDVEGAARFFVEKRYECQYGLDIEAVLNAPQGE